MKFFLEHMPQSNDKEIESYRTVRTFVSGLFPENQNITNGTISIIETEISEEAVKLHSLAENYIKAGKKFGFFSQHSDRYPALTKLAEDTKSLLSNEHLTSEDYCNLATKVDKIRQEVLQSHKAHSFMGRLGITHSRLEQLLDKYLDELVNNKRISKEELVEIKNQNTIQQNTRDVPIFGPPKK